MKRAWNYVVTMWQPVGLFLVASIIIFILFFFRLGARMPNMAKVEVNYRDSATSIKKILDNPVNAPYKIVRYSAYNAHKGPAFERLTSAIVASLSIVLFYKLARRLFSRRAALLGLVLYATSSTLLNNGRLATPNIMLLSLLALVYCSYELRFSKHSTIAWATASLVVGLSLYTPGIVYFLIAAIAWRIKQIIRTNNIPSAKTLWISSVILVSILVPLVMGFVTHPAIWREYLGVPAIFPSPIAFLKNLAAVPLGIFIRSPFNPVYRLGHQAVLDVFASVLFIIGGYSVIRQYRLDRIYLFGGILMLGTLFTAFSGNFENSLILLPFIYLIVTDGINFLLNSWRTVFPLNPLARTLSIGIMTLAVLISSNFQSRRYFIAWTHNFQVKAVFNIK